MLADLEVSVLPINPLFFFQNKKPSISKNIKHPKNIKHFKEIKHLRKEDCYLNSYPIDTSIDSLCRPGNKAITA